MHFGAYAGFADPTLEPVIEKASGWRSLSADALSEEGMQARGAEEPKPPRGSPDGFALLAPRVGIACTATSVPLATVCGGRPAIESATRVICSLSCVVNLWGAPQQTAGSLCTCGIMWLLDYFWSMLNSLGGRTAHPCRLPMPSAAWPRGPHCQGSCQLSQRCACAAACSAANQVATRLAAKPRTQAS